MRATDQDRIIPTRPRRSPLAVAAVLLMTIAGMAGMGYFYLHNADPAQQQQLAALKHVVDDVDLPTEPTGAGPAVTTPTPTTAVTPNLPEPASAEPPATAEALPALDDADAFTRETLNSLLNETRQAQLGALLVNDQWLRRFVTFVNNIAAGKIDHKSGPFLPIKGAFAVSGSMPMNMTPASQQRYDIYVELLTSIDARQCAAVYKRLYPLLSAAFAELGEPGNFHHTLLKAVQLLLDTPDLTQTPMLAPADKGLYRFVEPQLEALPAAQKQMLRMGWENVSHMKIWLRQLQTALAEKNT